MHLRFDIDECGHGFGDYYRCGHDELRFAVNDTYWLQDVLVLSLFEEIRFLVFFYFGSIQDQGLSYLCSVTARLKLNFK
jgi:hypothetical protein